MRDWPLPSKEAQRRTPLVRLVVEDHKCRGHLLHGCLRAVSSRV